MQRHIFIISVIIASFVFSNNSEAEFWNSTSFSAKGRQFQPVPTGHTPGKDNGPGFGFHNAGDDCGICHKPYGKAPNKVFTMSGTFYEDRAARKPLKGGEVILQDINGKIISMTSNESGNFWTYEPIGGNPYTVVGKGAGLRLYTTDVSGFRPADSKYPQTWQYKTWVKSGDHVLPMVTIAPVGGATVTNGVPDINSRMSCSMHHAPLGSRGALWAGTKSTLPSYPASGLSFKRHIQPIFKNKCIPCHIPGSTITRIVTKSDIVTTFPNATTTWVDYSNDLDLITYNGAKTKKLSDAVIRGTILPKTDGTIPHAGGKFWSAGDADYEAINKWIDEGGNP